MSFPEVLGEPCREKETSSSPAATASRPAPRCSPTAWKARAARTATGSTRRSSSARIPLTPPTNARLGAGPLFVLEGDEYPSSNTDPRSKFLHYHPRHLLITPLAHDHLNVFPTPDDYRRAVPQLLTLPPPDGAIVACAEGELSRGVPRRKSRGPSSPMGFDAGDFRAADIVWGETTQLHAAASRLAPSRGLTTTQLGEHNIQNIVGVAALPARRSASCTLDAFRAAIASFRGIRAAARPQVGEDHRSRSSRASARPTTRRAARLRR